MIWLDAIYNFSAGSWLHNINPLHELYCHDFSPVGLSKNMGDLQLIVAHVILDVHMLRNILIVLGLP
jgi:hypothetical protein